MNVSAKQLKALIEDELALVSDSRVLNHIRSLLVEPTSVMLPWDYGAPDARYECWLVLEEVIGPGIAYSEHGFGPKTPWGLVATGQDMSESSMGPDCGWFPLFMDAYFESAASEIPIWRVFKRSDGDPYPGSAISPEMDWDSSWRSVYALRESDDTAQYDVSHSIQYGNGTQGILQTDSEGTQ